MCLVYAAFLSRSFCRVADAQRWGSRQTHEKRTLNNFVRSRDQSIFSESIHLEQTVRHLIQFWHSDVRLKCGIASDSGRGK